MPTPQPTAVNGGHTGPNQELSSLGVIGTLGTADTGGTAQTLPFAVDGKTGAAWNIEIGTPPTNVLTGTLNTLGTVGTILGIGGTVAVSGASAGTYNNIATGTQQTLGTVGTITGIGIVTRIGNIGTIESGTVTTSLALNTGTITTIVAGTQNTLGTVGVINGGTITASCPFGTLLGTYTTTGTGGTFNAASAPTKTYGLAVSATGAVTSWDVRLEGALDNANFTQILAHTNATGSGTTIWTGANISPSLQFRTRIAGLVLGVSGTNIIITGLGIQ